MDKPVRIGSWQVSFASGWIRPRLRPGARKNRPDARLLQVLKVLAERPGELLSNDEILALAWPDRVVGRDSVTTAVYQLRQLLGDSKDAPSYIASEPRRGYRLIAKVTEPRLSAAFALPALGAVIAVAGLVLAVTTPPEPAYVYVAPLQNYAESPVQEPLISAVRSTLLSELIQTVPGRVRINDSDEVRLRLEAMMVACDLGPTMVMRLLDRSSDTYVWSNTYNLEEIAASTGRPTLVEIAASDFGAALRNLPNE